jgi:hypothetical protein
MLLSKINKEVENFKNKQIQIVPGLSFNQYETIEKIFFYYNSKFKSGEVDDEGDRKYFYNIVKNPCKVFSKAIDFDTKNIRLLTTGGGDPLKTWFMERDLKFWMRDQKFGKVLNRVFKELPIFGTVVLKIIDGKPYFVDLRNFVVEQSADDLDSMNYKIEVHHLTPEQFRKIGKQMKWKQSKIDEAIEKFYEMRDTSHIRLFERYGTVEEESENGDKTYPYKRVFIADVGVDEYDRFGQLTAARPGVEMSSEEWEGHPYWEFHAEKMPGRWLGIGVVETLFEPQIRQNEIVNLQSKTSYWSALRLFFSRDPGMNGNLMTEKKNGDVITGDSEITQIDMSDRNLAFFNEETAKWLRNRDELTFSYDVVQGERLPAGTPLGSAQIAATQTLSYFEQIQENVALDIKELLYTVIIPQFEKENNDEHTIRLVGQDLDTYIGMVKNDLVMKEIVRQAIGSLSGKPFPTEEDKEIAAIAIEESIKQGKEKILDVPKGYYKGIKYDVDIDITGESVDTRVRAATKFAIAQMITADPTMSTDPFKRKILMSYMEDGGINPNDFFDIQSKGIESYAPEGRAGGGVSAPALGAQIPGQVATTV